MNLELNKIYCGDTLSVLKAWPDEFIDCVITSPPYWGLRDYGVEGQLGLKKTPEEYVAKLVEIFREVKRCLKKDGTVWLNLGDSYSTPKEGNTETNKNKNKTRVTDSFKKELPPGMKPKNLVGIPWRTAFALQADGWYLRQDIIWAKPNPMPESVTDRCTKSHEYIFLLTKNAKYYFDNGAIKEKATSTDTSERDRDGSKLNNTPGRTRMAGLTTNHYEMRNKRSVWQVATKSYTEAHFATFPQELIIPMIKTSKPDAVVFDPFMGSGTTAYVARMFGRSYLGIELNPEYIKLAEQRLSQNVLL